MINKGKTGRVQRIKKKQDNRWEFCGPEFAIQRLFRATL